MTTRRWRVSLLSGSVAAAVALGFLWPFLGDPYMVWLPIGAAAAAGLVVGGVAYLIVNVP